MRFPSLAGLNGAAHHPILEHIHDKFKGDFVVSVNQLGDLQLFRLFIIIIIMHTNTDWLTTLH